MSGNLIEAIKDLENQAVTEHSHYYVASCCRRAIAELERLTLENLQLEVQIRTVVSVIGGFVDGHPTSAINYLQRLRELLHIEAASQEGGNINARIDRLEDAVHEMNPGWMP